MMAHNGSAAAVAAVHSHVQCQTKGIDHAPSTAVLTGGQGGAVKTIVRSNAQKL